MEPQSGSVISGSDPGGYRKRRQQRIGRLLVIVAITALLLSVPWVTWKAYDNLLASVRALESLAHPDEERILVGRIRTEMAQAGNAVYRYTLTRSEEDLALYQSSRTNLESVLKSMDGTLSTETEPMLDTLQELLQERYIVFDDWVELAEKEAPNPYGQLSRVLNEAQSAAGSDSTGSGTEKKRSRRELQQELDALSSSAQQQAGYFTELESRIDRVRRQELLQEQARRRLAVQLASEDGELNRRILTWLERMENQVIQDAQLRSQRQRERSEEVNKLVVFYGVLATLILLLLISGLIILFRRGDQMENAMERTLEQERGLVRAREAFLANMSHELRTPLHAITGFAESLGRMELPPRARDYAGTISDAASHLLGLVEHVLDYARESSRDQHPRTDPVDVNELMREVVALVQTRADSKHLKLELELEEQVPRLVRSDQLRLRQALLNLANNAVKFTHQGHVRLRASGQPLGEGRFRLLLEVEDSGPGISPEDQQRIFEPFRQGGDEAKTYREGLGLGLAITTDLIQRMGGTLELESEPGQGSLFRLVLPVEVVPPDRESSVFENGSGPDTAFANNGTQRSNGQSADRRTELTRRFNGLRILAADDEAFNRKLLGHLLSGFDAEIVEDGQRAVEAGERSKPDLLLLDVRMPGMDGHATLRALRTRYPELPAAAITAGVTEAEKQACRDSGFQHMLSKPFSESELLQLLDDMIPQANDDPGNLELNSLRAVAGEDDNFVRDMLNILLERFQETRIEWEKALAEGDAAAVGASAHKLAAPVRQLGFDELANALRALESEVEGGISAEALANRCRRLQPMLHTAALRVAAELEKSKSAG